MVSSAASRLRPLSSTLGLTFRRHLLSLPSNLNQGFALLLSKRRTRGSALPRLAACILVALVAGTALAREQVSLELKQSSWRSGAFPVETLRKSCAALGIEIRTTPSARTLTIIYSEDPGAVYHGAEQYKLEARGTILTYELTMADTESTSIAHIRKQYQTYSTAFIPAVRSPTRKTVEDGLYRVVRDAFLKSDAFQLSCAVISAALGSRSAYRQLLDWAAKSPDGLAALDSIPLKAVSDLELTLLALAQGRLEDARDYPAGFGPNMVAFIRSHLLHGDRNRSIADSREIEAAVRKLVITVGALSRSNPQLARQSIPSLFTEAVFSTGSAASIERLLPFFNALVTSGLRLGNKCSLFRQVHGPGQDELLALLDRVGCSG